MLIHDEHVLPSALDTEWLPLLTRLNVNVLVTSDGRIRRSPDERRAWLEANVTSYFMSNKFCNEKGWPQVQELIHWWPVLKLHAKTTANTGSAWSLPWQERKPRLLEDPGSTSVGHRSQRIRKR